MSESAFVRLLLACAAVAPTLDRSIPSLATSADRFRVRSDLPTLRYMPEPRATKNQQPC